MTTNRYVNPVGLAEIAEFLAASTGTVPSPPGLCAWARDAEYQMANDNPPIIEVGASASLSGRPEMFTVSDAGIGSEEAGD